jgi:hypothetical protein
MAASGFTPLSLYYSTTTTTAPTSGNLVNGELAINIADGNLYYKTSGGVVKVIANANSAIGIFDTTGAIQVPAGTTGQRPTLAASALGTLVAGSLYTNGTYNNVLLSYFSGPTVGVGGAYPTVNMTVAGGVVTSVTLVSGGSGFSSAGTVLQVNNALIGGTGSGFRITVASLTPAEIRFNTTTGRFEGFDGVNWAPIGGSVASGTIYENTRTITANYTMTAGNGGESVGPITVNSGIVVTIPSTSRWVIL